MHGTLNRLIDAYAAGDRYAPDDGYVVLLKPCEKYRRDSRCDDPERQHGELSQPDLGLARV